MLMVESSLSQRASSSLHSGQSRVPCRDNKLCEGLVISPKTHIAPNGHGSTILVTLGDFHFWKAVTYRPFDISSINEYGNLVC